MNRYEVTLRDHETAEATVVTVDAIGVYDAITTAKAEREGWEVINVTMLNAVDNVNVTPPSQIKEDQ